MGAMRWRAAVLPLLVAGCGDGGGLGDEPTGRAVARITAVPAGVQCVRLTARGAAQNFSVSAASSTTLDLGPLTAGSMQVSALAYDVACPAANAAPTAAPTWVSDPVSVTVTVGLTSDVPVVLRPNTRGTATLDFVLPVRSVAAGLTSTYAVMRDGTVRAWGNNSYGQLGDGTTTNRAAPVVVPGLTGVRAVAAGGQHACALLEDGTARCWGRNTQGQVGDGANSLNRLTPTAVTGGLTFSQVVAGGEHTCALTTGGAVYCWGANASGQLGDGGVTGRAAPGPVAPTGAPPFGFSGAAVELAAGDGHTCARVPSNGAVFCWGGNGSGQFGNGTNGGSSVAVASGFYALRGVAAGANHTCGLVSNGTVRCTGLNDAGQVGDGTTTNRAGPTAVSNLQHIVQVVGGFRHTCALDRAGAVSCWGDNGSGAVGDGTGSNQSAPAPVLDLTNATQLACGGGHCCAVRGDGTLWCWGYNFWGQLGDGTTIDRFTAVRTRL